MVKYINFLLAWIIFHLWPAAVLMEAHRVVLDRPDLADDTFSVRATLLLFFVDPQALFLKLMEVFELSLSLSDNEELFSLFLDFKWIFLVFLKVNIPIQSETQGRQHARVAGLVLASTPDRMHGLCLPKLPLGLTAGVLMLVTYGR